MAAEETKNYRGETINRDSSTVRIVEVVARIRIRNSVIIVLWKANII